MVYHFKRRDRFTVRCYWLLGAGVIFSLLGIVGTAAFFLVMENGDPIPPAILVRRLILPHVALLSGLGLLLAAGILLRKHAILLERSSEGNS